MDESQFVIYEECSSPLGIQRNAGQKINITSNSFQTNTLTSTFITSAQNLPNNILTKSSSLPINHFIKEGVHTLSQAEILDPKNDCASHISILPSNLLNSSDLSLQGDKVLSEDNRIKVGNESAAANSYYTATENGSTSYRLLLASLPLVKNTLSDKSLNQTLLMGNHATPGEASSVSLTVDNQAKGDQWENDSSPLIVNTSSVIKCKKDASNSQVVVKLMQDDLNYDVMEIISPNLENSHVFELIDKNNELIKTPLSKEINNEVSSGNLRLISVSDDVKGNVSPTSSLLYTCCFCNKLFLSEVACNEHAKVCLPYSSTDSSARDSQLHEGDSFFDTKNISNNKKCLIKSNLVWICMICSQEFSKPVNLKIHYISHSLEELATVLMKCTLPSLPKIEKSNSMDHSTITDNLNPNITKLSDSIIGKLSTMLDVKKESISLKGGKDINALVDSDKVFDSPQSLVPKSPSDGGSFFKNKPYSKMKKAKINSKGQVKSSVNSSGLKSRDPHACPVCKKILSSRGNLAKHLIQHETVKPWVCKVCGSGFNSKRNHDYHYMQWHTTLRPSVCNICGKGYTNKGTLSEHMIFHKKEKDFKCLLCGKGFRTKKCMNRHMQRHESSRKFVCNLCFKAFRVNVDLVSHFKLVHSSEHRKNKSRSLKSQSSTQISHNSADQFLANDSTSQKNIKKKTLNFRNVESEQISSVKEQIQQTSNCDQLNKIKDFSDLLESPTNPILPNISNEFPVESLIQSRADPLVNGENIETPTIIPVSSANERHMYNNSYDLTLHNKHSVTNADLSSGTFVIIGVAENQAGVESSYEKGTWNNLTEYKSVYQDIASKGPSGTQNVPEIGLLPTVLESIPQSYLDGVDEGVTPADNSVLTKPLKRTLSIEKALGEKELESNFGESKVGEGPKEEILTNDNQTQTLNLDLLSQTLHLDFHSSHGSNTATFL